MKKNSRILLIIVVLIVVGPLLHEGRYFFSANSSDPSTKIIIIEPGSFYKNAEELARQGLVQHPKHFARIVRILQLQSRIKIGEYEVRANMSPFEILKVLVSGKSVLHAVHIPEGFNLDQISEELASKKLVTKSFLKLARDPIVAHRFGVNDSTLEGYLFPETYNFTHYTGDRVILKTMVDKFMEVYNHDVKPLAEKQGISMHDVVTLASIIEKETGVPEERPLISSVFHNRMKIGMALQSDPTVIYGKLGDKKNITRKDLTTPTPYNTYTLKGLPVGPISNPGRESMLAVLTPAKSNFLYFVSKNNGTHVFTSTYAEHRKAVAKFQLDPAAREGHSWRERLQKKGSTQSTSPESLHPTSQGNKTSANN